MGVFLEQERQFMRKDVVNRVKVGEVCGKANIIITHETEEDRLAHGKISLMSTAELCFLLSE